ncbi:hypothetical protein L1987_10117 [Smallanthus sonchifolius]|uniref:Uncharacterized protein n=1 Tax=Smallanthus sonchifolius TaxID=185202 RepID=A0ACB9JR80_9ASTR|nr:hypothetical protein L1987_10117 [Smallanthus sonchifolius]
MITIEDVIEELLQATSTDIPSGLINRRLQFLRNMSIIKYPYFHLSCSQFILVLLVVVCQMHSIASIWVY